MKIALVGYGKMGKAVERHALQRGHSVVCTIDAGEEDKYDSPEFASADAVIEFTTPAAAVANYRRILPTGKPLVSGTTAWNKDLRAAAEIKQLASESPSGMFWTSNFSIGVALFGWLVEKATRLMNGYPQYRPKLNEIHHIHKLDHPSGTAVTTAGLIINADRCLKNWTEDEALAASDPSQLLITHERIGEVPGTHTVTWSSSVDEISLEHKAFSRDGFALGAVIAAEWLAANPSPGIHGMDEIMKD